MQTMPDKNRRLVTIGAILLGAVVLGAVTFFALNREEKAPVAEKSPTSAAESVLEEETGTPVSSNTEPAKQLAPADAAGKDSTADAAAGEDAAAAPTEAGEADAANPETAEALPDGLSVPATHVVAAGETLRDISLKYYGDPVYAGDIEALNQLEDPNQITVGQILQLPRPEDLR